MSDGRYFSTTKKGKCNIEPDLDLDERTSNNTSRQHDDLMFLISQARSTSSSKN